jgi:hypothetical protein
MENLMNRMVVDILSNPENYDKKKKEDHDDKMSAMMGTDRSCDLCGDYPCVWIVQRAAVVANDERTHTYNIENKTRRKVGYRHMFRVVNGGPGKRSSKTPPGMRRNWRSGPLPRRSIHGIHGGGSEILHLNFV